MATLRAIRNNESTTNANAARVDMKLEVVIIPVSDVDRAKEFYAKLGWNDPDGNGWLLQELTTRRPRRGVSNFDVPTMTELLRETEEHHGKYEPTAPTCVD